MQHFADSDNQFIVDIQHLISLIGPFVDRTFCWLVILLIND